MKSIDQNSNTPTVDDDSPQCRDAINSNIFKGNGSRKSKEAWAKQLEHELDLQCTNAINSFFSFLANNPGVTVEDQALKIQHLNVLWKNWLRLRQDKYRYKESKNFFLVKLNWIIGGKKFNEEQLRLMQQAGENGE